jgi:hypothetical protein
MNWCDMTGCHDTAEFFAEFVNTEETGPKTFVLEICESCADYWRNHKEETVKLTPYANRKAAQL